MGVQDRIQTLRVAPSPAAFGADAGNWRETLRRGQAAGIAGKIVGMNAAHIEFGSGR